MTTKIENKNCDTPSRVSCYGNSLPQKNPPLSRCMRTCACIRRGALGLRGEDLSNDQSHFHEFISNSNTFQKIYKIVFLIQIPKHSLLLKSAFKKFVTSKKKILWKRKTSPFHDMRVVPSKTVQKKSRLAHIFTNPRKREKK